MPARSGSGSISNPAIGQRFQEATGMDLQEKPRGRPIEVTLDEDTIGRSTSDVEHERAVAIYDLLEG
ncbi:UPF0262 family protein, partial [Acinetobacter baumannii]